MTGVEIQAHMISQILSAVLNQRPLIWWLPKPVEIIWIFCWSLLGAILAKISYSWHLIIKGGIAIAILCGSCFFVLSFQSGWIPLLPAILGLAISGGGTFFLLKNYNKYLQKRL